MFKQDIDLYVEYDRSAFENNCCSSEIRWLPVTPEAFHNVRADEERRSDGFTRIVKLVASRCGKEKLPSCRLACAFVRNVVFTTSRRLTGGQTVRAAFCFGSN